jgi:hypothetical protein
MIARLFGRLMRGIYAGEEKLIWNQPAVRSAPETIVLSSSAFQDGSAMPTRCAADRKTLLKEIDGRVLVRGRLIGTFERKVT